MKSGVDEYLAEAKAWRAEMDALRKIILRHPLAEELKWGKPCYTFQDANVLLIQPFKEHCSLLFCKGALLEDPEGVLKKPGENTQAARRLEFTGTGEITRMKSTVNALIRQAIDAEKSGREAASGGEPEAIPDELREMWHEVPGLEAAFKALTPGRQRGYILHFAGAKQSATRTSRIRKNVPKILAGKGLLDPDGRTAGKTKPSKKPAPEKDGVVLLSGGNPQIAKGDGDGPVRAYISAMPGWKRAVGEKLDEIIVRAVPDVRKAVKWNSPFYGGTGDGWFLSFHVLTRYVKVTFFDGASLAPIPPGSTERSRDARWIDIHEHDRIDEALMTSWIRQAAALPGWKP